MGYHPGGGHLSEPFAAPRDLVEPPVRVRWWVAALVFCAMNFLFAAVVCGGLIVAVPDLGGRGIPSAVTLMLLVASGYGVTGALVGGVVWTRLQRREVWRPVASVLAGVLVGASVTGAFIASRDYDAVWPTSSERAAFYAMWMALVGLLFGWPGLAAGEVVERIERARERREP